MAWHDDIANNGGISIGEVIKPVVNAMVCIRKFNEWPPLITGKSDKQHILAAKYRGSDRHWLRKDKKRY